MGGLRKTGPGRDPYVGVVGAQHRARQATVFRRLGVPSRGLRGRRNAIAWGGFRSGKVPRSTGTNYQNTAKSHRVGGNRSRSMRVRCVCGPAAGKLQLQHTWQGRPGHPQPRKPGFPYGARRLLPPKNRWKANIK